MSTALETTNLGKRYGRTWALRDCAVKLPAGRVAALVGPNGAGGGDGARIWRSGWGGGGAICGFRLLAARIPTGGAAVHRFLSARPSTLPRLLGSRTGRDQGRRLNPRWDQKAAVDRLSTLDIPLKRRADKLSAASRCRWPWPSALAKHPDLLLLDEPLARLDPLARRNFLRVLMGATAEDRLTVLLSSHIITDLERVCDYLIILSASRVQLAGDIGEMD